MPKRDVTAPSFKFWFEEKWYTEQGASTMARLATADDMATMRAEYTRMRDVAQKRIKRLGQKYPESETYKQHKEGFAKLKDIDPRDFPKAFSELAKFVKAKLSTVTGQRTAQEKTISTINKGIGADDGSQPPVTKKNYWEVIGLLNEARKQKKIYDSEKIVSLADMMIELNQDQKNDVLNNLSTALENAETLEADMAQYMEERNIDDFQKVNMDDFLKSLE